MLLPPVYRYLPQQYVDAFFEKGEIRLSSFRQFAKHNDEARGDTDEGKSMISSQGGGRQFSAFVIGGHQSYVLCGSYILSSAIMRKFDGCDSAIEITNVPDFAASIARQLAGFMSGLSGHCIYAGNRILVRHVEGDPFPLPDDPKEAIPMERMFAAANAAGQGEDLFLKHKRYAYQAEYRLIWNMDSEPSDNIVVTSKEAIQYCRRVSPEELADDENTQINEARRME